MQTRKGILAGSLAGVLILGACPLALAATSHYNDSSTTGGSAEWQAWNESWASLASDYTKVSLTPGKNENELNFAWYSQTQPGKMATPVVHFGTDKKGLTAFSGTSATVDTGLTDGVAYDYNHVTVTGLKPNTTYYYTVEKNSVQTDAQTYKTGDFESAQILLVGDPQVGASKGQPQGSEKLAADAGIANTAARNDGFAWKRTLNIALQQNPNLDFVISAGDQVNKTGKPKEEEYAAYLAPLSSLPVATAIGNHDSLNPDYLYHFNNPNTTSYGATQAGGDYFYSYGSGLFIVLNTNNYNVAEHEKALAAAVASDPDATFRIVTIHQDIYGSGLDHSDTDGMILRTQLTPVFDKYDIDVVLQGHDHTYSRSKLLYSDGKTHGSYEFQLNAEKTDYDWAHAYNTKTDEQIPLEPEDGDTEGHAKLSTFQADNNCYTIETVGGDTVTNPKGTLYMTANSATGSKFYELIASQQNYIAVRSQNWLPSYSVINLTKNSFSIDTYQITAEGRVEKIDNTFTIRKGASAPVTPNSSPLTRAQTMEKLYVMAGSADLGTNSGFSDVTANASYAKAVAWGKAKGIVNGRANGKFVPSDTLTREELATMLYRFDKAMGRATTVNNAVLSTYTDASSISVWARDAVSYVLSKGYMTGATATTFAPHAMVTTIPTLSAN